MSFNNKSRLDPSQVQDRRGRGSGTKVAVGGGVSLVIFVVALLLGVNPSNLTQLLGGAASAPETTTSSYNDLATTCQTGADANKSQECAIVGYVNSFQAFWTDEFSAHGAEYQPAQTILFTGSTEAACGYASAAMGPFYCPNDQSVYLDLSFFDELETKYGAQGGPFAEAYVLAHEYGHHVQHLLGVLNTAGYSSTGPQSEAVAIELQADCLAGVWMHNAMQTGYIAQITEDDLRSALNAAESIGDDRIQKQVQGYVSPESWTHGSSAQREAALIDGIKLGDIETCSTPGT
ncbi:MAG TPA: neutral zinc metallopeptidase [Anaerolineaceae bacterium]|nr:neutral zinc metallopeptidase [Anaerolineaceae bacterium]